MPNGVLCDKCDNEPLHIRDIERMTLATDTSLVEALIPVPVKLHARPPQGEILRSDEMGDVKKRGAEILAVSQGGRKAERISATVQDASGQSSNSRISGRKRKQTEFYTAAMVDRMKTADASGSAPEDIEGGPTLTMTGVRARTPEM